MVERKISIRTISGPIGIAQDTGDAAQQNGWTPLMELTAVISLNLGIFNLLPIPILDGGVIMLLLIEGLMRRDISLTDQRARLPGRLRLPGSVRRHGHLQRPREDDPGTAISSTVAC